MTKAQRKKMIKETFTGTQVGMVLEDVRDDFKVIAEQHTDIMKNINNLRTGMNDLKTEVKDLRTGMKDLRTGMNDLKTEVKAEFKSISDYLSRIDDEYVNLRNEVAKVKIGKTNCRDFNWLKNRVLEIEKKLEEYKKQQTMLSAKM